MGNSHSGDNSNTTTSVNDQPITIIKEEVDVEEDKSVDDALQNHGSSVIRILMLVIIFICILVFILLVVPVIFVGGLSTFKYFRKD